MNAIELGFSIVSVLVLIVSIYSLQDCMKDRAALTLNGATDATKIIAKANARSEWFKIAIAIVMMVSSGAALWLAPPPPGFDMEPEDAVFTVGWIVVAVLMIVSSVCDKLIRRKLIRLAGDNLHRRRRTDGVMNQQTFDRKMK